MNGGIAVGATMLACALAGVGDDNADASIFAAMGAACAAPCALARRRVRHPRRVSPGRVFGGIALAWTALVAFGTAVYLVTGVFSRIDHALVESAAGFSTSAVTLLDVDDVSRTVLLWRAASSWVGGLAAIAMSVVALPAVLRTTDLIGYSTGRRGRDLSPNPVVGSRRIVLLYSGFTAACMLAYLLTGLGALDSAVLGLSTASTGGFSGRSDSFVSLGVAAQTVATAAMLLAGTGVFVLWWLLRGRLRPLWRSQELRCYLLLAVAMTALLMLQSGVGWREAAFTATSTLSTTGFAMSDWTTWPALATAVLLVGAGAGTMIGSAGGGLKVMRARLLVASAGAELRRQLQPRTTVLVRRDGEPLPSETLERLGGHQIAFAALIGLGAVLLGLGGLSVSGSVWTSVSAVCTLGPSVGEVGAFGRIGGLDWSARLALVPLMMAGRMSMPPLLAVLGAGIEIQRHVLRNMRLLGRSAVSAVNAQLDEMPHLNRPRPASDAEVVDTASAAPDVGTAEKSSAAPGTEAVEKSSAAPGTEAAERG